MFDDLYADREVEGSLVLGSSSANFYPRNIIYNHELNNHGVSLIEGTAASGNFKSLNIAGEDHIVLCARGTSNPILVTRAGASYQGIHFIVVNRSPFDGEGDENVLMRDRTVNGVKLSQYYTTKYPGQKGYPVDGSGNPLQTYVNTLNSPASKYKERAEKVLEEVKTFDTNIERVIYEKYSNLEGAKLEFTEAGKPIEKAINDWIARSKQEKSNSTFDNWEEYWGEYIDMLAMQKEQSSKKLKKGCGIAFTLASKAKTQAELDAVDFSAADASFAGLSFDELFNQIGGACNDGETHK